MKKKLLILSCIILCINTLQSQIDWELLNPKPTANSGKDIEFVSKNTGYIITRNELLETHNAGETWSKMRNIYSGNDIAFFDTMGYIAGDYGYVLKSTDSGSSWTQIFTGYDGNINSINIIDKDTIILSTSNSIVQSNDAGITWERLDIPNVTVNKTFFTSSLVGHAVCNNGIILKTIDGGQNWYRTRDNSNITPSDYFTVYFINENIGFATKEHSDILRTTDGGETWNGVPGIVDAIYSFYFLDENIGYATGDHGVIFKTIDSGNTWNWAGFQNGRIYNTSIYGVYFENENIGYATGARGRILKTTDGGNNWIAHSEVYNDLNDLKIFDSGIGFARSGSTYYKTTDFGENWTSVSSVDHYSWATDSHFIDENIGFSLGGGVVEDLFKTTDGGNTWTEIDFSGVEPAYTVFFIDENIGFISGGGGSGAFLKGAYKTTNGGDTWTKVLSGIPFGQIQFVNGLVGYGNRVGHYDGAIYKTIDGGDTWNISIEVEGKGINAFHFVNEDNGYFVGDQGLIYKTNDGGTNWEALEIPYEWYTQVKFYTKDIGYIADEEGRLYLTEDGGEHWEFLTQKYRINSIEFVDDNIYLAGTNGKIYRSDVNTSTLNLKKVDFKNEFSIYPNPASDFVYIKSNASEKAKYIELYTALGQHVYSVDVSNNADIKLDVSGLLMGIYFIKVRFENSNTVSSKLIIN